MAFLFGDSFEHYSTAQLARKWTGSQYSAAIATSGGRIDNGQCLSLGSSSSAVWRSLPNSATLHCGFGFQVDTFSYSEDFFRIRDGSTNQIYLTLNTDGSIAVKSGTTLATTSTGLIVPGQWCHMQLSVTINDSTGSFVFKINNVTVASDTNVDTKVSANAYANQIFLWNQNNSVTTKFDDLYVCDDSGSYCNTLLGDGRMECLNPSGAGNSTNLTPSAGANYECVDESVSDDDTTYNSAASAVKDTYAMDNLVTTAGTVHVVQAISTVRKDDAGSVTGNNVIRSGGTDYAQASHALADDYEMRTNILERDPNGSIAWTVSSVNALENGWERTA